MKRIFDAQLIGPFAAMLIVAVIVALTTERFLNPGNLSNLSLQVSIVALIAIGSTIVIFAAGIDLSSGSMIALLTMILAQMLKFMGLPLALAVPLILVVGGLLGLFIGLITAYGRIPSFITTLAGLIAFRGLALTFNNGSPIFSLDPALEPIFYGKVVGIPLPFFYLVFFYAIAAFAMNYTKLGREIYAVGGNPAAAVLTGINVRKVQTTTFVIAGFMTAVGAVLMSARLNSGSPNYGQTLELQAIAAAVVGGASLAGGARQYSGDADGSHDDCDRAERFEPKCRTVLCPKHRTGSDHPTGRWHRHVAGRNIRPDGASVWPFFLRYQERILT